MAAPWMFPQSPFFKYVADEAAVPGKNGASAALQAEFDAMLRGTFVFVASDNAIYCKPSLGTYASGNRIVLISSGSGGESGVDQIFSTASGAVAVGNLVYKDPVANRVAPATAANATKPAFGMVIEVLDATTCVVREFGDGVGITGGGAFTPGGTVYLSDLVAGAATQTVPATAGAVVQKIGVAKNTTDVILGITPTFGGGIYAPDGGPAHPSLSFVNDPDTGFFRIGSGTIGIGVNGVTLGGFDASGLTLLADGAPLSGYSTLITLIHTAGGAPAPGIGERIALRAESLVGADVAVGCYQGSLLTVVAGAEIGVMDIVPAYADTVLSAGLRVSGLSGASGPVVNGLEVDPITAAAAATTGVVLTPYGSTADVSLNLHAKGTGRTMLRNAGNTITVLGTEVVGSAGLFGVVAQSASPAAGLSPITCSTQSGRVTFTDNSAVFVITNTLVTAATQVYVTPVSIDAGIFIQTVVSAANTITITTSAPTLGITVTFFLVNPAS